MTTISSSLNKGEDGLPGINRTMLGQITGLLKHLTRAEFDSAVSAERARIASNSMGVFQNGERLYIIGEEGYRVWSLASGSTDAANAASSHAKMVVLPNGKSLTLAADNNTISLTSGQPVGGIDGNAAIDWTTSTLYVRNSGFWDVVLNMAPAYIKIGDYTTSQITALNAAIFSGTAPTYPTGSAVWNTTLGEIWSLRGLGNAAAFAAVSGINPVVVTGISGVGQVLTATISSGWVYTSFQWKRDSAGIVIDIPGATNLTYTQVSADVASGAIIYPIAYGLSYAAGGVSAVITVLTITGTPAIQASLGIAYLFTPTVSGGVGAKVFSLASGTLPAGITLNTATGALTGTPTTIGVSSNISIRVTDSAATVANLVPFTLTVVSSVPTGALLLNTQSIMLNSAYIVLA